MVVLIRMHVYDTHIWVADMWLSCTTIIYELHVYNYRHLTICYIMHTYDTHMWVADIWLSYTTIIYELHVNQYRHLTMGYMIHIYDTHIWETRIWLQPSDDTLYDTHIWYTHMICRHMIIIYEHHFHLLQTYNLVGIW